ncbi:FkbM family methyltransferase [Mucilaginibacter conchicola]|uniref:FkbM family methyltransferase n=1 Tax=Mucilaginibacter conchicola TaxID=2303333 RepID=A0A372NZZ1_9SPHI|nr:FkbM family methyltransferase [Mucilaginibacter conchicola]RFZ95592.1 FkbM family methyltransferase [Mucilaginibacter conchicola]
MIYLIKKAVKKVAAWFKPNQSSNLTYSQTGEDVIVRHIFSQLGIYKPTYIDIGAHHPTYLNNTYLFYKSGASGLNIEPDPFLYTEFTKKRPRDKNLNVGASFNGLEEDLDFYIMSARALNTFSKTEAERVESFGSYTIKSVSKVRTVNLDSVFKQHFKDGKVDFLTIDVEGLDLEIVKTIDFDFLKPKVICLETINYAEDRSEKKNYDLINYVTAKNYFVYADTYINTILVDSTVWANR